MKSKLLNLLLIIVTFVLSLNTNLIAQNVMTEESLIQLNRVSGVGITPNGQNLIYRITKYDLSDDSRNTSYYKMSVNGGITTKLDNIDGLLPDAMVSANGKYRIITKDVKLKKISGQDFYNDVPKSNVMIIDELNYRHWDTWEDGAYSHVMYQEANNEKATPIDIMTEEPFDCPQKPFGGSEDYLWHPDGKSILYVTKKNTGTTYAISTNSDIYQYNLDTKKTTNLTPNNKGYDTQPAFSPNNQLAWLQMNRNGYESDKNDIIIRIDGVDVNITADWDGTVNSFSWGLEGKKIYFIAPSMGTVHLFEIDIPKSSKKICDPKQITKGQFDVNGMVGQVGNSMIVSRRDMNHAVELYKVNLRNGKMIQLTHANDATYNSIKMGKVEKRMTTTTDGKQMLSWVIYPPDFDPTKKYPTILYCQGGPQGALSQFYSYRWNFQLMAAHGYIIIAPNRRGMPGYGVEWNEQISKDYGGQNMQDYLSAIDDISKEPYVDTNHLGCIGASYGGYSVFYLAGMHNKRFKTFISHDGIFNWKSMYGTTEEVFFPNWDLGGAYWDKDNKAAQKTYNHFDPSNMVNKWDTPILIIQGGKDYRVPIGQGLEAFQAAQLQGVKSKLLFFPEENHWVLDAHNSLVWQREFYKWLKETM